MATADPEATSSGFCFPLLLVWLMCPLVKGHSWLLRGTLPPGRLALPSAAAACGSGLTGSFSANAEGLSPPVHGQKPNPTDQIIAIVSRCVVTAVSAERLGLPSQVRPPPGLVGKPVKQRLPLSGGSGGGRLWSPPVPSAQTSRWGLRAAHEGPLPNHLPAPSLCVMDSGSPPPPMEGRH